MITSLADLTTILATGPSQWSLMDPYLTQSQCCQEFLRDLYWAPYFFLSTLTTNLPAVVGNHYTNVNLFADDVLLYHQILITDTMDYAVLQEAITLLEYWSITTHLNFNVSKCKYPPPLPGTWSFPERTSQLSRQTSCICLETLCKGWNATNTWAYSSSMHITATCSKAKQIFGLL